MAWDVGVMAYGSRVMAINLVSLSLVLCLCGSITLSAHTALAGSQNGPSDSDLDFSLPPVPNQGPAGPNWVGDSWSGCKVYVSDATNQTSLHWEGPCVNGVANGRGKLSYYINGSPTNTYEGTMKNGKLDGHIEARYENGDHYSGLFVNGIMQGKTDNAIRNEQAQARVIAAHNARKSIGDTVCMEGTGNGIFGSYGYRIKGFVENISGNKVQIRVASYAGLSEYNGVDIFNNSIIWDDAQNWAVCQ